MKLKIQKKTLPKKNKKNHHTHIEIRNKEKGKKGKK